MYTMKQVCDEVGISYETLRFYYNEGLIPNVKRDKNNYRLFDEKNIAWVRSLQCLRKCGMSIKTMKEYLELSIQGASSVAKRKELLGIQKEILEAKMNEIQESLDFVNNKQAYFESVLNGEVEYVSKIFNGEEYKTNQ